MAGAKLCCAMNEARAENVEGMPYNHSINIKHFRNVVPPVICFLHRFCQFGRQFCSYGTITWSILDSMPLHVHKKMVIFLLSTTNLVPHTLSEVLES